MSTQRNKLALVLLTVSVFVIALACLAWALTHLNQPAPYYSVYPLMGAALMAVGAIFSAPLPPRMPIRITLTPTACLVCASALPVPWVILCAAVGVTVARIVTRYPRSSGLHKAVHNSSVDVVVAAVASSAMYAFGVRSGFAEAVPANPSLHRHLLGFLVAGVAVLAIEELVTTTAVALATGRRFAAVLRYLWRTRLLVGAAEVLTAGLVAIVTGLDKRALIALPAVMFVLHLAVTYRLRLREERRAWEHLAALSDALTNRDLDVVLRTAATGAVELFGAQAAEIELGGGRRLVRADGNASVVYDGPAGAASERGGRRVASIVHEIGAEATGLQGVLRLYLAGPRDVLSLRERSTLQAFSAAISTSLDNAHAYERLADEARQHEHRATHDPDTMMPNRAALLDRIAESAVGTCHFVAIRLENYRFLANSIGRDSGLVLLNELAGRLCHASQDACSAVARIGDAEFGLVMWDLTERIAYQRACWTVAALRRQVRVGPARLTVRVSAGMTSGDPKGAVELLDAAERVMWRSIRRGQDRLVSYQAGPVRGLTLAQELARARMSISFEPIVDLASGKIAMVQSVPRWLYSRYDVLSTDEYVYQLLDDQDVVDTLARTVLTRSMSAAVTWREVLSQAALVVPVPARALTSRFVETVRDLLRQQVIPGSSLVLAVGQSADLSSLDVVDQIRQYGVRLLLDDYGSRQGSIESLAAATWSFLRVHPAYALDAGWRPAWSVIRAAVDLAIDLDLAVIAPGIADEEQRQELAKLGCALGSGAVFGGEMFPSQFRDHAALWQPPKLGGQGARVLPLLRYRAG